MKKILVPTDLSEVAETGLKLGAEIASRCGAEISLINFTRHPLGKTFSASGEINPEADAEENVFTLELLQAKKEKLAALARKYGAGGVAIKYAVIDDEFRNGIDSYLSEEHIDLIAMGTSGEQSAREVFSGNHTLQVIRISSCPVLSVRGSFNVEDFSNIVAAVSVITDNQVADGLSILHQLADCFDATVHLVHVRDKACDSNIILDEYFTRMAAIAGLRKFAINIIDGDDVSEAVVNYAEKVNAGLIAVLKNSPDGIFRIFSNRVAEKIIREEGRAVFTLNLQNT